MSDETRVQERSEVEKAEDRLTNLRGALSERARLLIEQSGQYTDTHGFTQGFIAGIEHCRLVTQLFMTTEGYNKEVIDALVEEEAEFRAELDRKIDRS